MWIGDAVQNDLFASPPALISRPEPRALWPHQEEALRSLRQAMREGSRTPCLQMPTGAGKTLLAAAIIRGALEKGNRVVFCAPAISLINQTVEAFEREGIPHIGVIQAQHERTDPSAPVQVASRDTLRRRDLPEVGLAIIDECHQGPKFYAEWIAAKPELKFIGLSATPWAPGLGRIFDRLINVVSIDDLIEAGRLSPYRVIAPSATLDLSRIKTTAGDYNQGQLSEYMSKEPLVADVVQTWLERGEDRPTLCFGVDRAHARFLQAEFQRRGVSTGYIDANTPVGEREEIARQFHSGEVKVVCNVGVLTTGIDWDVRCLILARPTKSRMLYVQIVGRALRTAKGKDYALIIDHSDTTGRLGLVSDIHVPDLDMGDLNDSGEAKASETKLPKACPGCGTLRAPSMSPCGVCGHVPQPKRQNVEVIDGELVEVSRGERKPREKASAADKRYFYGELRAIGLERGYAPGWAKIKFREKFGEWPPNGQPLEVEPSAATRNWVKSRQIAWARAKAKDNGAARSPQLL